MIGIPTRRPSRDRRRAGWALAFSVAASLLVVPTVSDASPPTPLRIMPLGDSNTDGFAVPGGYRIDLEDDLSAAGYTVDFVGSLANGPTDLADRDHEGHAGFTIEAIRGGFGAWYAASPADVILLMAGTNDLKLGATTGGDPVAAAARLRQLLVDITTQAPDAEVLVSTLPPQTPLDAQTRVAQFNAIVPAVVEDLVSAGRAVTLVDGAAALTPADLVDSLHLSAGGFSKLADAWSSGISAVMPVQPTTSVAATTSVPLSVVAVDGFGRGDSVGLGSADVGGVWGLSGAGFGVSGGAAVALAGGVGEGVALLDVGVDVAVESVVRLSSGNAAPGLSVRAVDARNQLLVSLVRRTGQDRVSLFKIDQGVYRELGRLSGLGLVAGGSYVLRVEVVGSLVRVLVDGVVAFEHVLVGADAVTFASASRAGLRTYGGAEDGGSRWDDFVVTSLDTPS